MNGVDDFRGCLRGRKVKTVPWALLAALKGKGGRGGRGDGGQKRRGSERKVGDPMQSNTGGKERAFQKGGLS